MFRKLLVSLAALGLVSAPAMAQAPRAASPVDDSEQVAGSPVLLIAGLAVFAGIIAWLVVDMEDDEEPASP